MFVRYLHRREQKKITSTALFYVPSFVYHFFVVSDHYNILRVRFHL